MIDPQRWLRLETQRGLRASACCLLAAIVAACGGTAEVVRPLTARGDVDAIFAEYDRPGSPGCALGVIQNGDFVYRRGYGSAHLEHAVPLDADSVLKVASVSKQFTGMLILLLDERGDLALDDELGTWIPEMADLGPITINHLLHHTSGLRDYLTLTRLAGYREHDYFTAADVLDLMSRQRELNFAPGDEYLYSNTGYVLLALIAERATERSFADLAHDLIFTPLGMESTQFDVDPMAVVPRRAQGYATSPEGFVVSMTDLPIVGDGGLLTTVNDLLVWDRNFYENRLGKGDPELIRRWVTPGRLNGGGGATLTGGGTYGAGIIVDEYRGVGRVRHSGSYVGYRGNISRYPAVRATVITLCNAAGADAPGLADSVADVFLDTVLAPAAADSAPAPEAPASDAFTVAVSQLRQYQGRYVSRELGVTYVLRIRDGRLVASLPDRWETVLSALGDGIFVDPATDVRIRFARNSAQRVDGFLLDAERVVGLRFERIG